MQRVAIARALVNDPDILLADEPTGALDSDTSLQVMDLLKEVAKDRLVVMVTHNPELAEKYATRIVNLKDGKIISDNDPFDIDEKNFAAPKHENMGKTSMSFLTSLTLSFNNLKTKKGRTLLTSFAGSIGIIGIALILSLSNGINTYIHDIEEDTLSEYPLQIQSTGFDMTSMLTDTSQSNQKAEDEIGAIDMMTNMFSKIGSNDLASLKTYLEDPSVQLEQYTNALEYTYNVTPQIYALEEDGYRQVNPDNSLSALGISSSNSSNSMMSSMMSTDMFYALPSNPSLYTDQYDIKAGHWPQNAEECVLVLTSKGNVSDFLLYTLGLRDPDELNQMVNDFAAEKEVVVPKNDDTYTYDEILNISFKVVNASSYYVYDETYQVYKDKTSDQAYMQQLVENGQDLKIVGIVQPKAGATAAMLTFGIYYPAALTNQIIEQAQNSEIVQAQRANPEINVFTGKRFDDTEQSESLDMSSLFSVDQNRLQSAFSVDQDAIQLDLSQLNQALTHVSLPPLDLQTILSQLDFSFEPDLLCQLSENIIQAYQEDLKNHPELDSSALQTSVLAYFQSPEVNQMLKEGIENILKENGEASATVEQLQALLEDILNGYEAYAKVNQLPSMQDYIQNFTDYLQSAEAEQIVAESLDQMIEESGLATQLETIMTNYTQQAMSSLAQPLQEALQTSMSSFSQSLANAIHFDSDAFAEAFQMNMSEAELSELMSALMTQDYASYETNLRKLNDAEFEKPAGISIYPKDFESKEAILNILDTYNQKMEAQDEEDKVITYTDIVGTLMSSVTDIINVISYVLIAFVAISLIVSSIMIGVITYISVLERKKEIGILRAIGASKRNVSQVFNAETLIIGLCAGLIGIGMTLALLIPINQVIHSIAGSQQVSAALPWNGAIILIVLSTLLTLIGGIIPSRKAAKEDPVAALRTE